MYTVTLKEKRTAFFVKYVSEAKHDSKKLFSIINVLCDKKHDCDYPDCGSITNLVNEFCNYFMDNSTIHRDIDVIGQRIIIRREGTGVTLKCFQTII